MMERANQRSGRHRGRPLQKLQPTYLFTLELRGFCFQRGDFLLELSHLTRLVVLSPGTGQLLPKKLQLLLDDLQPLFGPAVHSKSTPPSRDQTWSRCVG